jgi:ribonuclease HI
MQNIYTDGSCLGNPGPGGWAVLGPDFKLSGGQDNTTNNIMEMTAVVMALEECIERKIGSVTIFTDSNYVKNGITSWIKKWKLNGWKTSTGTAVKNKDLWVKIDQLSQEISNVEWKWVRAHNGQPQNELVDTMARQEATRIKNARVK